MLRYTYIACLVSNTEVIYRSYTRFWSRTLCVGGRAVHRWHKMLLSLLFASHSFPTSYNKPVLGTRLLSLHNTLERLPMSASSAYELPEYCVISGLRSGTKERWAAAGRTVICYRSSGAKPSVLSSRDVLVKTTWPLTLGPVSFPVRPVTNCRSALYVIPEQRGS
jgi:hypothetical protein